jgi:hypothetical protein
MRLDERQIERSNSRSLNLIAAVVLIAAAWHFDVLHVLGY